MGAPFPTQLAAVPILTTGGMHSPINSSIRFKLDYIDGSDQIIWSMITALTGPDSQSHHQSAWLEFDLDHVLKSHWIKGNL